MSLADNLLVNALVQRARQESQAMTQGRLGLGPDPNQGPGLNLGRGAGVALAPLHALGLAMEAGSTIGKLGTGTTAALLGALRRAQEGRYGSTVNAVAQTVPVVGAIANASEAGRHMGGLDPLQVGPFHRADAERALAAFMAQPGPAGALAANEQLAHTNRFASGAANELLNPINWGGTIARSPGLLGKAGTALNAVNEAPALPLRALLAAKRGVPVGDELARVLGLAAPAAQSPELAAAAADFASKASQRGPIPPRFTPEPLAQGPLRRGQTTLDPTHLPIGPRLPPVVGPARPGRTVVPETTLPDISYRPGNVPGRTPIGPALPPELGPLLPPEQGPALPTTGNVPRNLLELIGRKRQLGPPVPPAALPSLTAAVDAPQVASTYGRETFSLGNPEQLQDIATRLGVSQRPSQAPNPLADLLTSARGMGAPEPPPASTVADLAGNVSRDAVVRATANGPVAQLNTVLRDIHNAVYPAGSRDFAIPALTGVGARDFRTTFLTDHPEGNAAEPYLDYLISRVQRDTKAADRLAQSNPDLLADIRALPEHPRPLEEQKRAIQAMFGAGPFKDDVTRAVAGATPDVAAATKQIATANPSELQTAFDAILASGDSGRMSGELPAGTAFWERRLGVGPDEARALLDGAVADGRLGVGPDGALRFKPRALDTALANPAHDITSPTPLSNVDIAPEAAPRPSTAPLADYVPPEANRPPADAALNDVMARIDNMTPEEKAALTREDLERLHIDSIKAGLGVRAEMERALREDATNNYRPPRWIWTDDTPPPDAVRYDWQPKSGKPVPADWRERLGQPPSTVEPLPPPPAQPSAGELLRRYRERWPEGTPVAPEAVPEADPRARLNALQDQLAAREDNAPNIRDYGGNIDTFRAASEAYHAQTRAMRQELDTLATEVFAARKPTPATPPAVDPTLPKWERDLAEARQRPAPAYLAAMPDEELRRLEFASLHSPEVRAEVERRGLPLITQDEFYGTTPKAKKGTRVAPPVTPTQARDELFADAADVPKPKPLGGDIAAGGGGGGGLGLAAPAIGRAGEAGVGALAGGAIGGAAGLTQGDTPAERRANALKGAGIGLAVGGNVGYASPELLAAARQIAPTVAQKLGGSVLDPEMQAMALQHAWDAQKAAPETAGVRGLEAFPAFWRQWGRQVVHTLKQFPQDATTRLTTLLGVAEQEFPGTSGRIPFWQKGLVQERAGQQSFLNNPVTSWFRDTGHADLIPLHGDIVGAEGTDVALAPQGKQFGGLGRAISGGLMSAWTGNPIAMAYGAARGYAAPFVDAYVGLLNGAQHDALRFGMLESALDRDMPALADTFLADLRSRGVDTATLDGLGGRFSAADVDALAPGAGRDWADASEFLIRANGDRIAFLSGDFRDKLAPGYTGKVTTLDKVVGRALKGLGPLAPFVQWQIRYTPVLAEIAARNPVATRLTLGAMAQGGTVDISTETPVLGAAARLRLGGQAGTVKVNPFAAVTPYSPESINQAPELPEDATLYQRATNLGGKVGIRPHPLIQALAYVGGQDYRAPSSLSRTAGLEGLADIPLQLAGVPNGPGVRGALDAGRQLLSPVTGAGIPQSDPTATRYAELVLRTTGRPLSDPSNRGYMETIGERDNPLWVRALLESRGLAAAGNATGMAVPVPVTARSQEGLAAKAAPKLPVTIGQIRAAPSSDRAALLDAYQRAAASSPASATYAGTNSKDRRFILVQRWESEHQAMKRMAPQLYADRRAAYAESLR